MKLYMFSSSTEGAVHYVAAESMANAAALLHELAPNVDYMKRKPKRRSTSFPWGFEEVLARWAWAPDTKRMIHTPGKGGLCRAAIDNHYGYGARFRFETDFDFEAVPVCETCRIVLRHVGYSFRAGAG